MTLITSTIHPWYFSLSVLSPPVLLALARRLSAHYLSDASSKSLRWVCKARANEMALASELCHQ